jgi:hypothetical protein
MTPNFFHSFDRICQNRVVKIDREEPDRALKKLVIWITTPNHRR